MIEKGGEHGDGGWGMGRMTGRFGTRMGWKVRGGEVKQMLVQKI